jgi:hypothetical protein
MRDPYLFGGSVLEDELLDGLSLAPSTPELAVIIESKLSLPLRVSSVVTSDHTISNYFA